MDFAGPYRALSLCDDFTCQVLQWQILSYFFHKQGIGRCSRE
jgi:hypothetical protein